ncbi:polysaccharide deacetylase [Rhodococcus sp. Eu-32]|uniref:polysaccharide deacetylase family protein n=1 Tax=Rhodococcus sp. Eu-32 TaxID=1017319 RepID=UPI000DF1384D|nr:polysaccharide deacetylase [Rhodococcus sp. Eu-32]RRQ26576.1 polysaccharide deacetylase [Rhodococcus sp. Eu-32]
MTEPHSDDPWQWPESTWRPIVEHVRAGRSLSPSTWPGDADVAVAVSFDSDHETPALRDGSVTPGVLSGGQYGARVALPRIDALLARHEVPASFFVPAVSALLYPEQIDAALAGGHEIAVHGWIHERNTLLSRDDEFDLTLRSIDTLEKLSGKRPVGIRTPSWDFSPNTLDIIRELGFLYDSSLMADDDPYELVAAGEPTGIVELPVEWIRDDAPYFGMARFAGLRPYTAPGAVLDIWKREFDGARAEKGVFQLTMHPSIIGHRSRLWILDELLTYIRSTSNPWFATHEQLATLVAGKDIS